MTIPWPSGRRGRRILAGLGLCALGLGFGGPGLAPARAGDPAWNVLWDKVDRALGTRVDDGWVRYDGLLGDAHFAVAWRALIGVSHDELSHWPREERLAFWINAYNLATLKLVADHYPIQGRFPYSLVLPDNSILMIPGRWKGNRFPLAGAERSLDHIEHEILRREFDEPRIHFAIVCASIGCPVLRGEAYRGARLDTQLEAQARAYFERSTGLILEDPDRSRPTLRLTKILDWFGEDFLDLPADPEILRAQAHEERGPLLARVAVWMPPPVVSLLRKTEVRVKWIGYDWRLNEPANRPGAED